MKRSAGIFMVWIAVCLSACSREWGETERRKPGSGKTDLPGQGEDTAGMIRPFIPVGRVSADVMEITMSQRQIELTERLMGAIGKDPEWWLEHSKKKRGPDNALPYDPRLGMTEKEYDEFRSLRPELKKTGQTTLTVSKKGEEVYVLDGGSMGALTGIEVDLKQNVVRTPLGILAERYEIKAEPGERATAPLRKVGWRMADFKGGLEKSVDLSLGRSEKDGRGILHYSIIQGLNRAYIILIYDLPAEKK
jgi:hypothetical protein